MKLAIFLLLLAVFAPRARAEDGNTPDFQVEVDPNVYPSAEFEAKGVKSANLPPREKRPDALPDKKDREAVFARVPGLAADVKAMDELDRDLLFVRAKTLAQPELAKKYPQITAKKLSRLRAECRKTP